MSKTPNRNGFGFSALQTRDELYPLVPSKKDLEALIPKLGVAKGIAILEGTVGEMRVPSPLENYMEVVKSILYSMGIDNAEPDDMWLVANYQTRMSEEDCAEEWARLHYETKRKKQPKHGK